MSSLLQNIGRAVGNLVKHPVEAFITFCTRMVEVVYGPQHPRAERMQQALGEKKTANKPIDERDMGTKPKGPDDPEQMV